MKIRFLVVLKMALGVGVFVGALVASRGGRGGLPCYLPHASFHIHCKADIFNKQAAYNFVEFLTSSNLKK